VAAYHRGHTAAELAGVQHLTGDRNDTARLNQALHDFRPHTVVDTVPYCANDVRAVTSAMPSTADRLVLLSSGDVYQQYDVFRRVPGVAPSVTPLTEDAPLRTHLHPYRAQASGPDDLRYHYDKIEAECTAREASPIPVTILRLPMIYGPGDPQHRVHGYLERMRGAQEIRLNSAEARWRCTRGFVGDVTEAIGMAATDPRAVGETFNLGEPEALTEQDWVLAIAAAIHWPGAVISDPETAPSQPAAWTADLVVDTSLFRHRMGYAESIGRDEGLRRTVDVSLR
jgi:nucleoside-diphosphate-sugar epimerase